MKLKKMRNWIRYSGLWCLSRSYSKTVPTILMYHSISDKNKQFFTVNPGLFQRQLEYLVEKGHKFVSMDDIAYFYHSEKNLPNNSVCLTFDDGYRDNLNEALPILEEFNIPTTIYFATDFVVFEKGKKGLPICSIDELQQLAKHPLITIGSHTKSHPKLSELSNNEAQEEIIIGKKTLEKLLGKPVHHFAYPDGHFSERTVEIVKNAGFSTAVTVIPKYVGYDNDPFRIGRVPVDQSLPLWLFQSCCKEGITVYSIIREKIIRNMSK